MPTPQSFEYKLTAERARKVFDYDPATGSLRWRVQLRGRGRVGAEAGSNHTGRYRVVMIDQRYYLVHRVIWLMVHGSWPVNEIDHRNNIGTDNRLENLREATRSQNGMNRGRPANNTSGFLGVCWDASKGRWLATIRINGRQRSLGRFKTKEAAADAYVKAATEHHGEFARTA